MGDRSSKAWKASEYKYEYFNSSISVKHYGSKLSASRLRLKRVLGLENKMDSTLIHMGITEVYMLKNSIQINKN